MKSKKVNKKDKKKILNKECPINLLKIGIENNNLKENEEGISNAPENIILVEYSKNNYVAYNKLALVTWINYNKNNNKLPLIEYKLTNNELLDLVNIILYSLLDKFNDRIPYQIFKLIK